jgi:hypothetical protein
MDARMIFALGLALTVVVVAVWLARWRMEE